MTIVLPISTNSHQYTLKETIPKIAYKIVHIAENNNVVSFCVSY